MTPHRTFITLPPPLIPLSKMCGPLLLTGSNQLVQVVHIGDLARGFAAAARFWVFCTRCINGSF